MAGSSLRSRHGLFRWIRAARKKSIGIADRRYSERRSREIGLGVWGSLPGTARSHRSSDLLAFAMDLSFADPERRHFAPARQSSSPRRGPRHRSGWQLDAGNTSRALARPVGWIALIVAPLQLLRASTFALMAMVGYATPGVFLATRIASFSGPSAISVKTSKWRAHHKIPGFFGYQLGTTPKLRGAQSEFRSPANH
jgi:hypothetical protein